MPAFPAYSPAARTFTPGDYPYSDFRSLSGRRSRVQHSNAPLAAPLQLVFKALSEAEMLIIWSHYQGQRGSFDPFTLPSATLTGMPGTQLVPLDHLWRYSQAPSIQEIPSDPDAIVYDVTVTLESVPAVGVFAPGVDLRIDLLLATGVAVSADASAPGAALVITMGLSTGAATGAISASAPGANFVVSFILATGGGFEAVDGSAAGADLTVAYSITGGAASEVTGEDDYFGSWSLQNYGWDADLYPDWWAN